MTPKASVIIVSRHRPTELRKCLRALELQTHPNFEVIVVTDPTGIEALVAAGMCDRIKHHMFDEANISIARNVGLSFAAGDIVAFIDDDAIAEPTWLLRLTQPFYEHDIVAAAGFVRSRNGISYRWRGDRIMPWGELCSFVAKDFTIYGPKDDDPVLTIGANCAFRRDALAAIDGFDPNFRMGLDDADVNVRLTRTGGHTLIVPDAQVQHVPAASAYRTGRQVPLSLAENGASFGWWLKKYDRPLNEFRRLRKSLRDGFLSLRLQRGDIEPRDVLHLMRGLDQGFIAGQSRTAVKRKISPAKLPFHKFTTAAKAGHIVLSGHFTAKRKLFDQARQRVEKGEAVTVILLSRTALFHRRRFHPDGFWVQSGGVFGKSDRSDPIFRYFRFAARIEKESADLAKTRDF